MSFFEAIYIDLKKVSGKAVNFVIGVILVVLLLFLAMNGFVFATCPTWFVILFIIAEAMILAFLSAKRYSAAGINTLLVLAMFAIAVSMGDNPWSSERQPLERVVVKFGDGPAIELMKPRVLAKQIRYWNKVFAMGMKKPDPKKNVIVLGGFNLDTTTNFWQTKHKNTNINLLDVKKIRHMGKVANNKEITLRNGSVISGTCLHFTNFMSLSPGKVWIEGKNHKGDKMELDFNDFNSKGEYIEFYWE